MQIATAHFQPAPMPITMGTVIHGTLRPQDLIPAFIAVLRTDAPSHYAALLASPFGLVPAYVMDEGDDSSWWDSEEAYYTLEGLVDTLNDIAPEGTYFGAHPGNASDMGFWSVDLLPIDL